MLVSRAMAMESGKPDSRSKTAKLLLDAILINAEILSLQAGVGRAIGVGNTGEDIDQFDVHRDGGGGFVCGRPAADRRPGRLRASRRASRG